MSDKLAYLTKVLCFSLYFLGTTSSSNAQLTEGDITFSLQGGVLSLNGFEERRPIGVNIDFTLKRNIGMHYNINFGQNYFHAPLAAAGTGVAMNYLLGSGIYAFGTSFFGGLLFALIPEGISYNIAFSKHVGFSPYVSPLQFNYIEKRNQTTGTNVYAGGAIGLKFNLILLDNIRISPFGEFRTHYNREPHLGTYFGIDLGYRLLRTRVYED